jgi:hypothetical protein
MTGPANSVSNICHAVVGGAGSAELLDRVATCERWLAERIKVEAGS